MRDVISVECIDVLNSGGFIHRGDTQWGGYRVRILIANHS